MLKFIYANQSEIPEALKENYTQVGNEWVLQVEGAVSKKEHSIKIDEFRTNNTELSKKLSTFEGIDPKRYKDLLALEQENTDPKKKKDLEAQIEARVKAIVDEHTKQYSDLETKYKNTELKLSQLLIDQALLDACTKKGMRPEAVEDVKFRGRSLFVMEDGRPVAIRDGAKVFNKNGELLTIENFAEELSQTAKHLFNDSHGSGSDASAGKGSPALNGTINPWKKETFNRTLQMKYLKEDKSKATKLAAAAGVNLQF